MAAVIFASGVGRRLKPLTDILPKPLIDLMLQSFVVRFPAEGKNQFIGGHADEREKTKKN